MTIGDVMSAKEAGELYGKAAHTLVQGCRSGRCRRDECRKSGAVGLITRAGMERLYGKEKDLTL